MRRTSSRPHQADPIQIDFVVDGSPRPLAIQIEPLNEEVLCRIAREVHGEYSSAEEMAQEVFQCALAEWEHIAARLKEARRNESFGDVPAAVAFRRKAHLRLQCAIREEVA